jgi:hypothetical protein
MPSTPTRSHDLPRRGRVSLDPTGYVRAMDARRQITKILNLTFDACDFVETR